MTQLEASEVREGELTDDDDDDDEMVVAFILRYSPLLSRLIELLF